VNISKTEYLHFIQPLRKSDLHNHAGRGGNKKSIEEFYDLKIGDPPERFSSLQNMQEWYVANIRNIASGRSGLIKRWEAAFRQANEDHVAVLSLSFGADESAVVGGLIPFVSLLTDMSAKYAPDCVFLPELSYLRGCDIHQAVAELDDILDLNFFKSIDICGDEFACSIDDFIPLYRKAEAHGLTLKAHVGEFGTADDVMRAVETLHLSEVHHGIAASTSPLVMNWLSNHKIQLNICPTSNVMLGLTPSYKTHPIKNLFHAGIPVTINTDDMLIFNQSVSEEYANLLCTGTFTLDEIEQIRLTGLAKYAKKN